MNAKKNAPESGTVVLATRNKGKIAELSSLFQALIPDLEVLGLDQFPQISDIPETGATFLDNARIKAEHASRMSGLVAVADDSGLEVDALNGAPGVYSARYSGEKATDGKNNAKLLTEMANIPQNQRTARFTCLVTAVSPNGQSIHAKGHWPGRIAFKPKGANGFGYDPLFVDEKSGLTAAEMTSDMKNARSHRAQALQELLIQWPDFWAKTQTPKMGSASNL